MKVKGLTLIEVLMTSSLSILILSLFLMIFIGINNESKLAETWSDIVSNSSIVIDEIKSEYLTIEYLFDRQQITELLPRFQNITLLNGTVFTNPVDNIQDFKDITFPNPSVGNAIAFISFEGVAIVEGVALPKYTIKLINLQQSPMSLLSLPNLRILDIVISQSQFIYSRENIEPPISNQNLKNKISNYIFFDKDRINDINNFFVFYNSALNSFDRYTGTINFPRQKILLKKESYQSIRYSISYNNQILGNVLTNYRVPAWTNPSFNFPNGLEILVIGNRSTRKIYTRLTVLADLSKGNLKFTSSTITYNFSEKF